MRRVGLFVSGVIGPQRGEVLLGFLFGLDKVGWNVGVEIVAAKIEVVEVGKVREGGRELPSEVVFVKEEMIKSGKCSELSRERAFEAIIDEPKRFEGGESADLRGHSITSRLAGAREGRETFEVRKGQNLTPHVVE